MGRRGENIKVANLALGVKRGTINSHLTKIFNKYMEALEVIDEYGGVFKGRMVNHSEEVQSLLNKNRRITK